MKKSCEHVERMLYNKGINGLSPLDRFLLKVHLRRCSYCRELYDFEENLKEMFDGAPRPACPPELAEKIRKHTANEGASVRFFATLFTLRKYSYSLAAAAAIALLLIMRPFSIERAAAPHGYTKEELSVARRQATWTLAYTGSILNKTNKKAVGKVLFGKIPETVKETLEQSLNIF